MACAVLAALVCAPAPASAAAPPPWSLRQLAAPYECITETTGECTQGTGRALFGANGIAVSGDGRFVYETGDTANAVGVFLRDRASGRLVEVSCVSSGTPQECPRTDVGLTGPEGIAISGDGRNVYVASFSSRSVNAYARNPVTGALKPLNCFSDTSGGDPYCTNTAIGLAGANGVTVVGNQVYVTGAQDAAITTFQRNATTGALSFQTGCLSSASSLPGCTTTGVHGMKQAGGVTASPDGHQLYVAGSTASAVTTFARASNGTLSFARCVSELQGSFGDPACGSHAAKGIGNPRTIAISSNGRSLYVSGGFGDAVAHFERTPASGALSFKGCAAEPRANPISEHGCAHTGRGLTNAEGVSISADGRSVYVASSDASALAAFRRDPVSGNIQQLASPYDCLTTLGGTSSDPGCGGRAKGLKGALGVAVPRDGRNVYATGYRSDALASFARTPPPRFAGVRIRSKKSKVHKRSASIDLGCPRLSQGCSGHLMLLRHGKGVGSSAFALGAGKHRSIKVLLAKATWSKLLSSGSLQARARVSASDGFGQAATTSRKITLQPS